MQCPEEGALELLTGKQFMQEVAHPGTKLLKQRVRVSFDFDVIVNDGPIRNANDDTICYDMALLNSFLTADKEKLLHMMIGAVSTELGLNSTESFMTQFLGQVDTNSHVIFGPAIDALRDDAGDYWREARDEGDLPWGDVLSLSTEKLFECFSAEFLSSSYEIVGEQDHDS